MTDVVLWDYPKSSASYRVRIALNLAGIPYKKENVDLLAGSQKSADHLARNPQGLVPVLDIDGLQMTQSLAMIEYIDETRNMGWLPTKPVSRAKLRALSYAIAVDLHPVCNSSVAAYASKGDEDAKVDWMRHFIRPRLQAFEAKLAGFNQAPFATGTEPGFADMILIPQLYNARRWGADYSDLPRICAVEKACATLSAFTQAAPTE